MEGWEHQDLTSPGAAHAQVRLHFPVLASKDCHILSGDQEMEAQRSWVTRPKSSDPGLWPSLDDGPHQQVGAGLPSGGMS